MVCGWMMVGLTVYTVPPENNCVVQILPLWCSLSYKVSLKCQWGTRRGKELSVTHIFVLVECFIDVKSALHKMSNKRALPSHLCMRRETMDKWSALLGHLHMSRDIVRKRSKKKCTSRPSPHEQRYPCGNGPKKSVLLVHFRMSR